MSIHGDFARRETADQYNSAIFSLLHYLSIRVAMTVKQSKFCQMLVSQSLFHLSFWFPYHNFSFMSNLCLYIYRTRKPRRNPPTRNEILPPLPALLQKDKVT